jgi:hypothetical protein
LSYWYFPQVSAVLRPGTRETSSTSSEDSSWYDEIADRSAVAIDPIASDEEFYARAAEYQTKLGVYRRLMADIEGVIAYGPTLHPPQPAPHTDVHASGGCPSSKTFVFSIPARHV